MYGASLNCRFAYPRTYLGKGCSNRTPLHPPRWKGLRPSPRNAHSHCVPPCSRRLLARRRGIMARTNDADAAPTGVSSGLVLASCLWHSAPHTATDPQGGSLGLLPCQRQARPTSRPASLWLPPCTVMADAMRPLGKPSSCPQTHHDRRETLALPSGYPSTGLGNGLSTRPSLCDYDGMQGHPHHSPAYVNLRPLTYPPTLLYTSKLRLI